MRSAAERQIVKAAKHAAGSGDAEPSVLDEDASIVEILRQRLALLDRGEPGIPAARALADVRKTIGMKRPRRR